MEAKTLASVRRVSVVCPSCQTRSEFELTNAVPIAACRQCGARLPIGPQGSPHVVNR